MAGVPPRMRGWVSSAVLSLPVVLWFSDDIYTVCRVRDDTSMEPAVRKGDVLLVRKADFLPGLVSSFFIGSSNDDKGVDNNNNIRQQQTQDATDLARVAKEEEMAAGRRSETPLFFARPPAILPGQVVVIKNPATAFPTQYQARRVVGLGGQIIQQLDPWAQRRVPPFSLWVETDKGSAAGAFNVNHGSISKKLILGKAERIIWPPSRWSKLERSQTRGKAWW